MATAETYSITHPDNVEGINLIVDGHSHILLQEGKRLADTVIVQANEYTKYLGKVVITFNNGESNLKASLISSEEVKANYDSDPEVEAMIKKCYNEYS